jgi:hypothetical protein
MEEEPIVLYTPISTRQDLPSQADADWRIGICHPRLGDAAGEGLRYLLETNKSYLQFSLR